MNIKSTEAILLNWHTTRWIVLSVGILLAATALWYQDIMTGLFSGFFLIQAITNTGCLVSRYCNTVNNENLPNSSHKETEVHFTEIK